MRRALPRFLLLAAGCLAALFFLVAPTGPVRRDDGRERHALVVPGAGQATVSPQRRVHILEGDARGGGHRPGRGLPDKSEFPHGWSDERIIAAIEDVANDPASRRRTEADGRAVVTGERHGVAVRVVIERDGRSIVTGYPLNMPRNPR